MRVCTTSTGDLGAVAFVVAVATAVGCTPASVRVLPEPRVEAPSKTVYRPAWTAAVAEQVDEIRACLKGHEPPAEVIHVRSLARSRATGVTWVDGTGAVEHCSAEGGTVLMRRPARAHPEDFAGLPRFVLTDDQGVSVPTGLLLEEVVREGEVLGWLYWSESTDREVAHATED